MSLAAGIRLTNQVQVEEWLSDISPNCTYVIRTRLDTDLYIHFRQKTFSHFFRREGREPSSLPDGFLAVRPRAEVFRCTQPPGAPPHALSAVSCWRAKGRAGAALETPAPHSRDDHVLEAPSAGQCWQDARRRADGRTDRPTVKPGAPVHATRTAR